MKYLFAFTLSLTLSLPAFAADKPAGPVAAKPSSAAVVKGKKLKVKKLASQISETPTLSEEELALAEAGEKLIKQEQQKKGGKPIPKEFQDKMNSTFPQE